LGGRDEKIVFEVSSGQKVRGMVIQVCGRYKCEANNLKPVLGKKCKTLLKNKPKQKWLGESFRQYSACLNKFEALNSNPNTAKKNKERERERERESNLRFDLVSS
jgi:hypothetical protein